jgi:hypothetical protein
MNAGENHMEIRRWILVGLLASGIARPLQAEVTAEQVRESIRRGVNYLKQEQDPRSGRWEEQAGFPGGISALCTLALLNCGVPVDDPALVKALNYVRSDKDGRKTYSVALETMVLCAAEPERDRLQISRNVAWLQRNQVAEGMRSGAWAYGELGGGIGSGDPSNTQFALMALYEAERVGVPVQDVVWRRALGYWTRLQNKDGSWSYSPDQDPKGSMTCAGIASTIIALGQLSEGDARVEGEEVLCCQPQADNQIPQRGLEWLARHFSVHSNPSADNGRGRNFSHSYLFYYLYGLERVGRMTANRFIGDHDWYREGSEYLLRAQDRISGAWKGDGVEMDPQIATPLALLFLSKGRRPVVAAKLQSDNQGDWNHHRSDLAHLTRDVERRWKRDLTWQVMHGQTATLEDLMQTPIVYLSGRDGLRLGPEQKELLKQYVEQGGFIFAEACCEGTGFDQDFRQLMAELFPDSPLRLLPPDHPVWFAEQRVPAEHVRPLYGIDSCCRTGVIYCPGELSCYWELAAPRRINELPARVKSQVQAALTIGANVITYATNRELKEKLDTPQLTVAPIDRQTNERGTLYVAKIQHSGGSDDAPNALMNLLQMSEETMQLRVTHDKQLLPLTAENLYDFPIIFMHGRRPFRWSPEQRKALAEYLRRGGFLFVDAICASQPFVEAFRREIQSVLPDNRLQPVPPDHPLLSPTFQGYDLSSVQLRNPGGGPGTDDPLRTRTEQITPVLEGIEIDGRLAVVFSPYDLSCALENQASIECKGYVREDAAKIGINVLLYAMQN